MYFNSLCCAVQTSSIVFDIDAQFMNVEKPNKLYHRPHNYFQLKPFQTLKKYARQSATAIYVNYTE